MDRLFLNRVTRGTESQKSTGKCQGSRKCRSRQSRGPLMNKSVQFILSRCVTETHRLTPTSKGSKEICFNRKKEGGRRKNREHNSDFYHIYTGCFHGNVPISLPENAPFLKYHRIHKTAVYYQTQLSFG